ncbi:MAG: hypothetical protein V3R73_07070, partial [Sphingomonadales bacterium]
DGSGRNGHHFALERAASIGSNPAIRPLFSEPRFQKFLREVGFINYWRKNGWPDGCRSLADGDFTCDAP